MPWGSVVISTCVSVVASSVISCLWFAKHLREVEKMNDEWLKEVRDSTLKIVKEKL